MLPARDSVRGVLWMGIMHLISGEAYRQSEAIRYKLPIVWDMRRPMEAAIQNVCGKREINT